MFPPAAGGCALRVRLRSPLTLGQRDTGEEPPRSPCGAPRRCHPSSVSWEKLRLRAGLCTVSRVRSPDARSFTDVSTCNLHLTRRSTEFTGFYCLCRAVQPSPSFLELCPHPRRRPRPLPQPPPVSVLSPDLPLPGVSQKWNPSPCGPLRVVLSVRSRPLGGSTQRHLPGFHSLRWPYPVLLCGRTTTSPGGPGAASACGQRAVVRGFPFPVFGVHTREQNCCVPGDVPGACVLTLCPTKLGVSEPEALP